MAGKIQGADVKTEAELISAGATKAQLPQDTQVYVTSQGINDTLYNAILNGQIGQGGINYVSNYGAEADASGHVAYADAAAVTPVDGAGGTPNTTITRSTSSPLRGAGSFLVTKTAANRQGEGVGIAFTISSADKNKQLRINFDYEASVNYTGSTGTEFMVCYVYDVTNSVLIPTSTVAMPFGSGTQQITFSSTSATSYRLIFHIAGTGTSAWTYKYDNVQVGPQEVITAPAIGDWQTFTPTGSWTTNTTYAGKWKRVGDTMEVQVKMTLAGAPTAAALSVDLPTGYTIDSSKLADFSSANFIFGKGNIQDFSPTTNYVLAVTANSSTSMRVYWLNSANTALQQDTQVTSTTPITFATSDVLDLHFWVPISNWSSNIQLANSRVEYGSNSGMGNVADTTSFVNDRNGSPIPTVTYTSGRFKRVRFQNPIQASDTVVLQAKINNSIDSWVDMPVIYGDAGSSANIAQLDAGTGYGFGIFSIVNSTDVDVYFGQYAAPGSLNWSVSNTSRWRVVKYSNAVPVEAGTAFNSQIIRGNASSVGGTSSGDTTTVNYSAAISSVGADITFVARTSTTADYYLINTAGRYAIWATLRDTLGGNVHGITVNSSGASTAPQSLATTEVPSIVFSIGNSLNYNSVPGINLSAGTRVRVQVESSAVISATANTRFGITRIS